MLKKAKDLLKAMIMDNRTFCTGLIGAVWMVSGVFCFGTAKLTEHVALSGAYANKQSGKANNKNDASLVETNEGLENGGIRNMVFGALIMGAGGGSFFHRRRKARAAFSKASESKTPRMWKDASVNRAGIRSPASVLSAPEPHRHHVHLR